MTVDKYWQAPWWKQAAYRIFRHPLFLFGLAPTINFVLLTRFPLGGEAHSHNGEGASVPWTNLAIAGGLAAATAFIGFGAVVMAQLPVMMIAAGVGTWLFYVQHQFERTYWEHTPE